MIARPIPSLIEARREMPHPVNRHGQPIGHALDSWKPPPTPDHVVMQGRFCRIEPLAPARHAESLDRALRSDVDDGRTWTYLPYGPFDSSEQLRSWLESISASQDPLFFAILDRSDGTAAGMASYLRIAPSQGCIEVGHVHFADRIKRSPVATESMFLMMQYVFDLGYRRYEWKCDALNAASRSAAERLGFLHEGLFRHAAVYKGRNRDTAWYAVIDSQWNRLRDAFTTWLHPSNFDRAGQQRVRLSELTRSIPREEDSWLAAE